MEAELRTELNEESNKLEGHIESLAHRPKDLTRLPDELRLEGEDLSVEYDDPDDVEDHEGYEYEEDWEDEE